MNLFPISVDYATIATHLDTDMDYNAAVVANWFLTVVKSVRKQTGLNIGMSVRSSQWLKARMCYLQKGHGRST